MSHNNHNAHDNINDHEDPDGWATWAIGIGGSFLMIATVLIAAGIYYRSLMTESEVKNINIVFEQRNMINEAQQAALEESAHWERRHDPKTGEQHDRLVIPINEAMNIVAGNTK
ncbi:MAG: hypothetical protein HOC93_03375 [Phycisphaerae bacterium]|jgi:hypothetical protein|nr:hypothetical protein [Phycisphaerae bacterium]HJN70957.1 hypothetical protein [Phycisphaerales bacterium]|tara:strand:+ start:107 stop:448 length:342 start_codon:yes stop_codon:yes gene_type:complete